MAIRFSLKDAGVVYEIFGCGVVGAVDDEVPGADQLTHVVGVYDGMDRHDLYVWVEGGYPLHGALHLWSADVACRVKYLPLEIGAVHYVEIHDSKPSDARGGEIECSRRAEPAGTDDKNLRGHQSPLSVEADLLQQDLSIVTLCLFVCHSHTGKRPLLM